MAYGTYSTPAHRKIASFNRRIVELQKERTEHYESGTPMTDIRQNTEDALLREYRATAFAAGKAARDREIVAWLRNRKEMTDRHIDYIETAQAADCIEDGEV